MEIVWGWFLIAIVSSESRTLLVKLDACWVPGSNSTLKSSSLSENARSLRSTS